MRLLAIDAALDDASAAVWEGEGEPALGSVSEVVCTERATASRELLPAIDRLLGLRGWSTSDLDGVVLTLGPGSFTGLRIGVSLVKGLRSACPVRVAAVGTLDAIAVASGRSGHVAAVLDARRGEVYARLFRCDDGGAEPLGDEAVTTPDAWAASLPGGAALSCVGPGAARHADVLKTALGSRVSVAPGPLMTAAAAALHLGARLLASGRDTPVEALLPRYVRRSTAEANLERGVLGSRRRRMLGWDPARGRT
ncbi:MAG: tRNA (adenosine(37)-N6)-threonylcarbamoyltransferase complex dimerization subunit type 1 TsaB [Nitrospirota bacterium]